MTAKTAAQILAEIATTYPDNSVGFITPLGLRTVTDDIINSIMPTAPVGSGNAASYSGTTGLLQDSGVLTPASNIVGINDIQTLTNKTFVAPVLGAATATSINGNTLTAGSWTLTGGAGKTLTFNNSLTLAGTDATTMTFPATSATIARTDAANTFTGTQTIGALVATTINGNTFTSGTGTLTIAAGKTLTANSSLTLAGTDTTTMTFPGTSATIARTDAANGGSLLTNAASGGVGYATGAGGAVTQLTSRATGVTINTPTGAITLFSAAGSTTAASFTVTNSSVAATDVVHVSVKSATNAYVVGVVSTNAGSFQLMFFSTGGTAVDAPVFNFAVIKGSAS